MKDKVKITTRGRFLPNRTGYQLRGNESKREPETITECDREQNIADKAKPIKGQMLKYRCVPEFEGYAEFTVAVQTSTVISP
jgi:hypothetical protein